MLGSLFKRKVTSTDLYRCSFCGKSSVAVKILVAGPGIFICNECVDMCSSILDKHIPDRDARASKRLGEIHSDYTQLKTLRDTGQCEKNAFPQCVADMISQHFDGQGDGNPATVEKLPPSAK
jgi:ATP-dependent protease Clp ATPase subunit